MTLILETGAGLRDANSYVLASFVTSYLTARNRLTENSWSSLTSDDQDAACIAATSYVDIRHGPRLKGYRSVNFDGVSAEGNIAFSGLPTASETLTLGNVTYTFVSSLSSLTSDYEVLIGADAAETATNLLDAISGDSDAMGSTISDNVLENRTASGEINDSDTGQIDLTAAIEGLSGNDITLSTAATNVSVTTFVNGLDAGPQPREFPRASLYGYDGVLIEGVPLKVKHATAEYAVRAASAELFQDPTVDATGRAIVRKKTGPLETQFAGGAALDLLIKPYPAADRLMREFLTSTRTGRA